MITYLGKHNLIEFRKETNKILEEKMGIKMPENTETYILDSLGFDSIELPENRWKPYCNKNAQVVRFDHIYSNKNTNHFIISVLT